jgi:UDPglucose 6-dehydrogenase
MRISVIGTGYVGLVSGVCLAEIGHQVVCVDIDPVKVAKVRSGVPPIHEDGLEHLLRTNLGTRFSATSDLQAAVLSSDLTLIAVGTPFDGRTIDLSAVKQAATAIGTALRDKDGHHVVIVKSTVVPGTTDSVVRPLLEQASGRSSGRDLGVGMNPEFLTEGRAVRDFMEPDRIVFGGDARTMQALDEMYASFRDVPKIRTNPRTAEMIKYASNALLATAISFSNEIANLCAAVGGIDIVDVMEGVHASSYLTVTSRSGERSRPAITSFLQAGCGFGGSCLPKDVRALIAHGESVGSPMPLLRAVIEVNEAQPDQILRILEKHFATLAGLRVGVLGLAFKPDTDDIRESPSIRVIQSLLARGASVKAYDPVATAAAKGVLGSSVAYAADMDECLRSVDAVVLLTSWRQFESVPAKLGALESAPLLLDGRRLLDKAAVTRYAGIGV